MTPRLPLTKYHQIYLVLREQLMEGRFVKAMPAEMVLAKQFNVGRVTVRHAMEKLVAEGLIVRVAGRGTFPKPAANPLPVLGTSAQTQPTSLAGLMENIVSASLTTTVKVLDWRIIEAPDEVAQALQIPVRSPVKKAIRLRSSKEGPLSYITTYMPLHVAAGIVRRDLAVKPMLQLMSEVGVVLGRAQQTISARQADARVAEALDVHIGSALLSVRRRVFDEDDKPVQWLEGLYRPDRYEYQLEVSKIGNVDARVSMKDKGTTS
jgi:GntR family transcriptional regulator